MGILSTVLIYKYGKKRALREAEERSEVERELCAECGYPRFMHNVPGEQCPS